MRRVVIIVLVAWLVLQTGALDALAAFMLAGVIPGTNTAAPAGLMLTIYVVVAVLLAHRLLFSGKNLTAPKKQIKTRAKRSTKRYSKA
jgi:hypothetical protein